MRIAVASSYGLAGREVERAFAEGVRAFFWGALRHRDFGVALRRLARRDRAKLTIATVSYASSPLALRTSIAFARRALAVDALDLVVLGYAKAPIDPRLIDAALALRERGVAKSIGVSSHDRALLASLGGAGWPDALMARYSAAHRGAASEVFPFAIDKRVLAYTATRWGTLLDPSRVPAGERAPTAAECYRFVLSCARVDLCLAGPRDGGELDAALAAGRAGPLTSDELAWMTRIGDAVRASARDPAPRRDFVRRAAGALRSLVTRGVTEDVISRFNR